MSAKKITPVRVYYNEVEITDGQPDSLVCLTSYDDKVALTEQSVITRSTWPVVKKTIDSMFKQME